MKVIKVPSPIMIEGQLDSISFFQFMKIGISTYAQFGNGLDNIERGLKLKTIAKEAEAKKQTKIYIEDADYEPLKTCLCDPRYDQQHNPLPPFVPLAAMDMVEFYRAVKNATQEVAPDITKNEAAQP